SEALGRRIERLVVLRMQNEQPDPDLVRWIPEHMRRDLVRIGLLDAEPAARATPLTDLLRSSRRRWRHASARSPGSDGSKPGRGSLSWARPSRCSRTWSLSRSNGT